ncbi:hypothetical protein U91I_03387 [alpha proteobacterium U9-1i]|nr:hypothetical protein U91I_03387 [alpha proteobacterium U9-1i]
MRKSFQAARKKLLRSDEFESFKTVLYAWQTTTSFDDKNSPFPRLVRADTPKANF